MRMFTVMCLYLASRVSLNDWTRTGLKLYFEAVRELDYEAKPQTSTFDLLTKLLEARVRNFKITI